MEQETKDVTAKVVNRPPFSDQNSAAKMAGIARSIRRGTLDAYSKWSIKQFRKEVKKTQMVILAEVRRTADILRQAQAAGGGLGFEREVDALIDQLLRFEKKIEREGFRAE